MTDKERILAEIDILKRCTMDEHMKFYCESAINFADALVKFLKNGGD